MIAVINKICFLPIVREKLSIILDLFTTSFMVSSIVYKFFHNTNLNNVGLDETTLCYHNDFGVLTEWKHSLSFVISELENREKSSRYLCISLCQKKA